MKAICSFLLLLFCFNAQASNDDLKRLLNERKQLEISYQNLQDSMIPGKVLKLYLVNELLMEMVSKDDSIILATNSLMKREKAYEDSIKKANIRLTELNFDNNRLQERTVNDMKMMLILKIAVAVLLVALLILVFVIFSRKNKDGTDRNFEEEISGLESLNISLKKEIDRHKIRELQFKDDLDRSIQSEQERYNGLNEKYNQLLVEIQQLRKVQGNQTHDSNNDYTLQINQLKVNNEQLVSRVSELQLQLEEARIKNQSILKKINKLITDLSGVN
jgi:hypothetical protein